MDNLDKVRELAKQLDQARHTKNEYEEKLKEINKEIRDIEECKLSPMLDELGISKMSLDNMDIAKSVIFRCPYTKHTDKDAFKFLFDSNNDGALKKQLIVDLEVYPRAAFELDLLGIEYKEEYSIHHATLSSIIKELVETGKFTTDDIEKYSIYIQPQVKIKEIK